LRVNDPPDPAELLRLRDELTEAVREAGALALRTFQTPLKTWTKHAASPVSEADIAVDNLLRERLAGSRRGFGWRSEESGDAGAHSAGGRVWIVDPIDGTRSYLAGRPDWVVSAALVEGGRPIAAAVFAPVSDELFVASAGGGAWRNGALIRATGGAELAGAAVAGPKRLVEAVALIEPRIVAAPRLGSLALRLVRVAQGALDVALAAGNSNDWDLAGADLLVHEAGGVLTNLAGWTLTYHRPESVHGALLAAGTDRHAALVAHTRDWVAEAG
jgi:myo-inositol-1(or 4)-monophosphatase